jgi:hypothetical protein
MVEEVFDVAISFLVRDEESAQHSQAVRKTAYSAGARTRDFFELIAVVLTTGSKKRTVKPRKGPTGWPKDKAMTRYIRRDNYECSVVNQPVTVAVLTGAQASLPQADQMRNCNFAHVCGKFGDPPLLSRFSSPGRTGCPYHDNLNTSAA